MTPEIQNKFMRLAAQLSPENLSCDGELSASKVRARRNRINKEWQALEKQVGRKVTEEETWGWSWNEVQG